jgi:Ca-activated chloride channel family protein
MKTIGMILTAAALAAPMLPAGAMSLPRDHAISIEAHMNCPVMPARGGRAYLQLAVNVPAIGERDRRPLNLCVVLDRSGSMGDEGKIMNARAALRAMIARLAPGDVFSLVIYDDVVDVLRAAAPVRNTDELCGLVEGITPRGFTNLGGGMIEGFRQVERYAGRGYVNRVVLLSDGLANRGITDPRELGRVACSHREGGISLSTMGVGLQYNENLMMALAGEGGGNYYFIERSGDLASILRREFDIMACVVAQNAVLSLDLSRGVCVSDVVGGTFTVSGDRVTIPVGDLTSGERREFTVELELPAGEGKRRIVSGSLRFDRVGELAFRGGTFAASVRYSEDVAEIDRNRDMKAQAEADVAVSTRNVDRAMDALDAGNGAAAAAEFSAATKALAASPAMNQPGAKEVLRVQMERLQSFEQEVGDTAKDRRMVKKSIQYRNYNVQRQK